MRISDWSSDVCSSDLVAGDVLDIGRLALLFKELDDGFHLAVADEGAVHPGDPPAMGHVQHVALAQKLLRPGLGEDGAAVDARGYRKRVVEGKGGSVSLDLGGRRSF